MEEVAQLYIQSLGWGRWSWAPSLALPFPAVEAVSLTGAECSAST